MTTATPVLVEACVDSVDGALAAERAGAGRVELCAGLTEGGTTPSAGVIAVACARLRIPVVVMVRPRGSECLYTEAELEVMTRDIVTARALGAAGVALGVLTPAGAVDIERLRALVRVAHPLPVTFHRAFDLTADPREALDALAEAGVTRVLTSGGAPSAAAGAATIAALVRAAGGRVAVMAGGGIDAASAATLVREAGVRELHVGGAVAVPGAMTFRRPGIAFGRPGPPDEYTVLAPDDARLRRVVAAASEAGHAAARA